MISQQFIGVRAHLNIALMLTLTLVGCTTTQRTSLPGQNFEPLPVYRQGTTFVYSDGTWETITAAASNIVTWEDHRGHTSTGTPDFTRRRIFYQTRTRQGTRIFGARENIVARGSDSLWPLKIGNKASYTERGTWKDKRNGSEHTYRAHWSCEVTGIERVAVPAGEFDTWKIVCSRYNSSRSPRSRPRQIKTWFYAPQISHFVLVTSKYFYDKPSRRQELLAVVPSRENLPKYARRKMDDSFQKALEYQVSGASTVWSLASAAASGGTTPYGTFKLEDGTFCRRYVQDLDFSGDKKTYYGMACRDSRGRWDIPKQ